MSEPWPILEARKVLARLDGGRQRHLEFGRDRNSGVIRLMSPWRELYARIRRRQFCQGGVLGLVAGYLGRGIGHVIMRLGDIVQSFPSLLLAVVVLYVLEPRVGNLVVVLDLSASMKAKGQDGTRFEAARKEFLALVDGLAAEQEMLVIGASTEPRLLAPFTADKRKLRALGRNLEATDAPGRIKEAILFAHAFLQRGGADQVVTISDGAFAGAEEFAKPTAHLRFINIAGPKAKAGGMVNLAIVGFALRRRPESPLAAEIMVHLRNFSPTARRAPLTLSLGERVLVREQIDIDADARRVLIYPVAALLPPVSPKVPRSFV